MQHYLLTRFNWSKGLEPWTEQRIALFSENTYPSVMGQTCKDFKWLIFCDPKTIEPWRSQISKFNSDNIRVIFAEPQHKHPWYNPTQEVLTDFIVPFIEPCDRLITTRLDSDDMLAPSFVERVQKAIDPSLENEVLIFPYGYIMDVDGNFRKKRWGDNPFVTASETWPNVKTAFGANHMRASRISTNYKNVDADPAWVCVCHTANFKNTLERRGVAGDPIVALEW